MSEQLYRLSFSDLSFELLARKRELHSMLWFAGALGSDLFWRCGTRRLRVSRLLGFTFCWRPAQVLSVLVPACTVESCVGLCSTDFVAVCQSPSRKPPLAATMKMFLKSIPARCCVDMIS